MIDETIFADARELEKVSNDRVILFHQEKGRYRENCPMVPRCRRLKLNFTRLIYTDLSKRCKSK